jgi:hypothetical protein
MVARQTWKGLGEFRSTQTLPEGLGRNKVSGMLAEVTRHLARRSKQFHSQTDELPFVYGEKQLHSVLFPAFDALGGVTFMEQKMARRSPAEKPGGYGWVDYWIDHRNVVLLVEVKHGFVAQTSSGTPNSSVRSAWCTCLHQIGGVVRTGARSIIADGQTAWAIGLMVVAHYRGVERTDDMPEWDSCWSAHTKLVKAMGKVKGASVRPVNWHGLWRLNSTLAETTYDEKPPRRYPAVSLIATAQPLR